MQPNNKDNNAPQNIDKVAKYTDFIKFYFLPIASLVVFFLIILYPVVGQFNALFDNLAEIDDLKAQNQAAQDRINRLSNLQQQNLARADLIRVLNELVPTGNSEVTRFRQRLADTTVRNNLELGTNKLSESATRSDVVGADDVDDVFRLVQIPTEFDLTGDFGSFRTFLDGLYSEGRDFFVINEMELGSSANANSIWNGSFNITKYQFLSGDTQGLQNIFYSVSEREQPNQTVIDFLEKRYLSSE